MEFGEWYERVGRLLQLGNSPVTLGEFSDEYLRNAWASLMTPEEFVAEVQDPLPQTTPRLQPNLEYDLPRFIRKPNQTIVGLIASVLSITGWLTWIGALVLFAIMIGGAGKVTATASFPGFPEGTLPSNSPFSGDASETLKAAAMINALVSFITLIAVGALWHWLAQMLLINWHRYQQAEDLSAQAKAKLGR